MELYSGVSYQLAEKLTKRYSTSFSMSSQLFDSSIRRYIYAIYGMVRIADEIVDSFRMADAEQQLEHFRQEVLTAIEAGYSTNPILHAFADTARQFSIDQKLIDPFFDSMKADLTKTSFNQKQYQDYIYGSAEVIGLMCLKVFINGDETEYKKLEHGAAKLGSAYQKVNFLRDFAEDYKTLGRVYFPGVSFDKFDETDKLSIIKDIKQDFTAASIAINDLPASSRKAVRMSYIYYMKLLQKIEKTPAETIKTQRVRIADAHKILLLIKAQVR